MEELIEIIIALIGKLMSPPKAAPPRQQPGRPPMLPSTPRVPSGHGGPAYKPIPGARAVPPARAVMKSKAAPARRGRRVQPQPMIAAPIITTQVDETPSPPQVTRPSGAKPISATAAAAATKTPAALDAAAFRRWLTPATLRQQFLLTEIFQPPIALRPPSDLQ